MGDSGCAQVLQKGNAIKFLAPFGTYRYKKRFYSCGGFNTRYFLSRNKGRNPAAFSYENDISRCSAVKLLIDGALGTKAAANIQNGAARIEAYGGADF